MTNGRMVLVAVSAVAPISPKSLIIPTGSLPLLPSIQSQSLIALHLNHHLHPLAMITTNLLQLRCRIRNVVPK